LKKVILASGSPRRLAILRAHGVSPTIILPAVDETLSVDDAALPAEQVAVRLALLKASDVAARLVSGEVFCSNCLPLTGLSQLVSGSVVLGADTLVYKEGTGILGKPKDRADAIRMLELLRATSHQVYTGVALVDVESGREQALCDVSTVTFSDYTRADIERFIEEDPPFDKAGSYAAQGMWAAHIESIRGDRENVIGLPWHRIEALLQDI
jgi:septum formation protein